MMNALDRVYYFHELVRKEKYPNAADIEEVFKVTGATARKDISYLKERLLAPLVYDEGHEGYTYRDMFHLPFENNPRFLFFISLVNHMAEESGLVGLPEIQTIKDKLNAMLPQSYRNVLNSIWTEWVEIEYVDSRVLQGIIEALHLGNAVSFVYHSVKGERSERIVDPWRLLNYQGRWYLIAYCQERKDRRHFHCARIRKINVLREKRSVEVPDNLREMEKGFGIFKGRKTRDVRIFFKKEAAAVVKYQVWHNEQMVQTAPGGIILTVPAADEREIMMKIMQYGSNARVLEPASLREQIRMEVKKMLSEFDELEEAT
ncbi:MAG: hypothetical protein CSA81_12130 [Acidobacteria bacterium]|nr:MAG: hypothetical protein CSA81_12130 [Acidobacteriota bacterium]